MALIPVSRVEHSQAYRVLRRRHPVAPSTVRAAPKSMTMMHESSFVPPYDAFFKNRLASAYEKPTGIKITTRW